jgi:hypothetical protein
VVTAVVISVVVGAVGGVALGTSQNRAEEEQAEAELAQRQDEQPPDLPEVAAEVPEAPFMDPMPRPEKAELVGAEPISVVGPVFGEDEALEVRDDLDFPFAFRLPDEEWICVITGAAPGETRRHCINEEPGGWTERVRIVWRLCPDDCPDDTAAALESDWPEGWLSEETGAEPSLEPVDDATAYAELSGVDDEGEDLYTLVVSHFFDTEFGPAHVGVITDGHASSTETLQKIANDVRTQAGAAG